MRLRRYLGILIAMCFLGAGRVSMGTAVPHLDIPDLVSKSDLAIVADVGDVKPVGPTRVGFGGIVLQGQRFRTEATRLYALFGSCPERFVVEFALPNSSNGYRAVEHGIRMLFLRKSGEIYTPANPYYPDFPALRIKPVEMDSKQGAELVIAELGAVVASADTSADEKLEVLLRSYAIPSDNQLFLHDLLVAARDTGNPEVHRRIQAILLSRNDISQLKDVCDALLAGTLPENQRQMLLDGIARTLTNKEALPLITKLLQSPDPKVRIGGAQALWHTASASSIGALIKALNDEDAEVRYYAIRGLANVTGELQWGPGIAEYEEHEAKYREHWLAWATQNSPPQPHN